MPLSLEEFAKRRYHKEPKLLTLVPKKVLQEIDAGIDAGYKQYTIANWLQKEHGLDITDSQVGTYIRWRARQ